MGLETVDLLLRVPVHLLPREGHQVTLLQPPVEYLSAYVGTSFRLFFATSPTVGIRGRRATTGRIRRRRRLVGVGPGPFPGYPPRDETGVPHFNPPSTQDGSGDTTIGPTQVRRDKGGVGGVVVVVVVRNPDPGLEN